MHPASFAVVITIADEQKLAFLQSNWGVMPDPPPALPEPSPLDSGQAKRAWVANVRLFPE